MAKTRKDGPTPAGGDYSVATYLDSNLVEVEETAATYAAIAEFLADGSMIAETFVLLKEPVAKVNETPDRRERFIWKPGDIQRVS